MAEKEKPNNDRMIKTLTFNADKTQADEELIHLVNRLGSLRRELTPKASARLEFIPALRAAVAKYESIASQLAMSSQQSMAVQH